PSALFRPSCELASLPSARYAQQCATSRSKFLVVRRVRCALAGRILAREGEQQNEHCTGKDAPEDVADETADPARGALRRIEYRDHGHVADFLESRLLVCLHERGDELLALDDLSRQALVLEAECRSVLIAAVRDEERAQRLGGGVQLRARRRKPVLQELALGGRLAVAPLPVELVDAVQQLPVDLH